MAPCPLRHQGALRIIVALMSGEVIRKVLWPPLHNPFAATPPAVRSPMPPGGSLRGRACAWPLRVGAARTTLVGPCAPQPGDFRTIATFSARLRQMARTICGTFYLRYALRDALRARGDTPGRHAIPAAPRGQDVHIAAICTSTYKDEAEGRCGLVHLPECHHSVH
jgi:hypothetical protein